MLTDGEIQEALAEGKLVIDPFFDACLQAASYDFRVGDQAFLSGTDAVADVANKGLIIIEPGEFAVIATRETVTCGPQFAAQLGLDSKYARQGLVLLSGPQIDPGFRGVLIVRVTNLAPRRITLTYEAPFLTVQFFRLARPVAKPYAGARQGQTGLGANDIEELSHPDSPTLGGMVKSLSTLASDVGDLKTAVKWMAWAVPAMVAIGMAVVGIIVGIK
ncbi:MAG: dCTP deaminase [Acidimicrobiales bacterium]